MKSKLMIFSFLIASLVFAQTKAPKIFAPEKIHNFGDIKEGKLIKYNFVIENKGDENLNINKVRASCGCTAVAPAKNILQPGDTTNIMVTFNSAHRSGLQRKHIYIFSNDPDNPQLRLSFTANVINKNAKNKLAKAPKIYFNTTQYNFGTVQAGTVVTGKLKFTNLGKSILKIEKIETSAMYINAFTDKSSLRSGAFGELGIKFNSTNRTGKLTRTVTIYSNDPRNPQEIITIFINIVPKG